MKIETLFRLSKGLTAAIVEQISEEKNDPLWMRQFRLRSLERYHQMQAPDWGPALDGLNMDHIVTYVRPNTSMKAKWSEVPREIKDTFQRLGIPQAERTSLAGVGAQYDSELVYHNVRREVEEQGVVYTDMESALTGPQADMVREHFMKAGAPGGSQIRRSSRGCMVRGILRLCAAGGCRWPSPCSRIFGSMPRGAGTV